MVCYVPYLTFIYSSLFRFNKYNDRKNKPSRSTMTSLELFELKTKKTIEERPTFNYQQPITYLKTFKVTKLKVTLRPISGSPQWVHESGGTFLGYIRNGIKQIVNLIVSSWYNPGPSSHPTEAVLSNHYVLMRRRSLSHLPSLSIFVFSSMTERSRKNTVRNSRYS